MIGQDGSLPAAQAKCDPQAFAALYDLYFTRIYNYARYRSDDEAEAEDLTAQVFEHLFGVIARYDPERGPFEAWLFAIVRHAVADQRRRKRFRAFLPWEAFLRRPSTDPPPEETVVQHELRESLLRALPRLVERERDALGLKYGLGLNNREIAGLMDVSENHVGVILFRAVDHLRRALVEQAGETAPNQAKKGF